MCMKINSSVGVKRGHNFFLYNAFRESIAVSLFGEGATCSTELEGEM